MDSFHARRQIALAHIRAVAEQKSKELVFSHLSAALLWDLPLLRIPRSTHINVTVNADRPASKDVTHHAFMIAPDDITVRSGLAVTSLERSVFDLALLGPIPQAFAAADAALRVGCKLGRVAELVESHGGYPGIRRARFVLAHADSRAETFWESVARLVVLALGLPCPDLQVRVTTRLGTFYLDMAWRQWGVAFEFDGLVKYTEFANGDPHRVLFEEKRRQNAIEEEGWRFIRVTRSDLKDPFDLLTRLSRVLPRSALEQRDPHLDWLSELS